MTAVLPERTAEEYDITRDPIWRRLPGDAEELKYHFSLFAMIRTRIVRTTQRSMEAAGRPICGQQNRFKYRLAVIF